MFKSLSDYHSFITIFKLKVSIFLTSCHIGIIFNFNNNSIRIFTNNMFFSFLFILICIICLWIILVYLTFTTFLDLIHDDDYNQKQDRSTNDQSNNNS